MTSALPHVNSSRTPPLRSVILLIEDDPFLGYARQSVLARRFPRVLRVTDAAEAFIKVDDPEVARDIAVVVVGLHLPGFAGPNFVSELISRIPGIPVLVIGRLGEIAPDYVGESVRFLPHHASSQDVLEGTRDLLAEFLRSVA